VPDSGQVVYQFQELLALGLVQAQSCLALLMGKLGFHLLGFSQSSFPFSLELTGDESILWIDLFITSLSESGGIVCAFQSELPLPAQLSLLTGHLLGDGQGELYLSGSQSIEHGGSDALVYRLTGHSLAHRFYIAPLSMVADVSNELTIFATVDDVHPLPTSTTQDPTAQESSAVPTATPGGRRVSISFE